jgi:hypothetical protein
MAPGATSFRIGDAQQVKTDLKRFEVLVLLLAGAVAGIFASTVFELFTKRSVITHNPG